MTTERGADRADGRVLSYEWRVWIAENLLAGVPARVVREKLVDANIPEPEVIARIEETLASPVFIAAKATAAKARALDKIVRLERTMLRDAASPRQIVRRADVDDETLFDHYYATSTPVVLTDVVSRWPARCRWSLRYFAERFGDVELDVTDDRESDPHYDKRAALHTRKTTMRALVERIEAVQGETNDFYAVANNKNIDRPELAELLADIVIPSAIAPETRGCSALWIGPAGTVTPLHHDTSNILFCQVVGRKRFLLASPTEIALLRTASEMYANVDPEKPGPLADEVLFKEVVLAPGEALFLPVGWWHHVRALDASISVAFNGFRRQNNLDWYRPGNDK